MLRSGPAERSSYGENITVEYERVYQAKSSEIIQPVLSSSTTSYLSTYVLTGTPAQSMIQAVPGASRQLQLGDEEQIDERLARRAHE